MSTLTEKLVDFDIMVESEPRREAPAKPGKVSDHTSALEESVFRLNGMLMSIKRTQKQYVNTAFFEASCLTRPQISHAGKQRFLDRQVYSKASLRLCSIVLYVLTWISTVVSSGTLLWRA